VRNERYWERDAAGTPLPYLDQIRLRLQKGLDVRLAFDTGRADVGAGTTRFRRTHRTFPVERNNTIGFGFNLSEPTPYARIPQLRRAMATAIAYDRVKPVRAFTVLPPGFAEFDGSRRGPAQDMAAAKEMLAKAGYPGGQGLPPLVVLFPQREAGGYDAVLDSWKELGIPIVPELVSGAQHWERIERGEAAAFRWGVVSGAEPAETVYSYFWSRTPYRGFEYRSAEYDAAFEAFLQADPARRRELAARLEDILGRDLPVIPVRRDIALWFEATQSWVHGYAPSVNPAGLRFFKIVRLGERAP
jgi:ABC-type transport system substrate-binding protein